MSAPARDVQVITYASAARLVAAALDHAAQNDWRVAAVAVDPWGAVVASGRMDGVPAPIMEIAADKAYTAALGKSTRAFGERMASSPGLTLGLQTRPRLCAWEGGLPVRLNGTLIGAIGVSGAAGEEDAACAGHALASIGAPES